MRNKFISSLTGAVFSFAASGLAFAADMAVKSAPPAPPPAVPSWTGFYIGIDAGGAWGLSDQKWQFTEPAGPLDPVDFGRSHQLGGVGGFLAGYNWQFSPAWVVGIEGDYNWASSSNTNTTRNITHGGVPVGLPGEFSLQMNQSLDWLASVRGRIGYVWGSSLWYATGGAAWEGVEYAGLFYDFGAPNGSLSATANTPNPINKTNSGWVAGGGVEYMATEHVLLRLEYLYYGFNGSTATAPYCFVAGGCSPGLFSTYSWSNNNVQTVRAALSYKF